MNRILHAIALLLVVFQSSRLDAQMPATPNTTDVMVLVTAKPGIERTQVASIVPEEVRATVRLYLDGKIRQWYSRADGSGVILIINARTVAEAQALVDSLPLAKAHLVDHQFIALAPLAPLARLLDAAAK